MICLNSDGIFCLNKEKILNPYIKGFKNEHVLVYYFFFIITLARIINVSFPVDGHDIISPILGSSSPQTFFVLAREGVHYYFVYLHPVRILLSAGFIYDVYVIFLTGHIQRNICYVVTVGRASAAGTTHFLQRCHLHPIDLLHPLTVP